MTTLKSPAKLATLKSPAKPATLRHKALKPTGMKFIPKMEMIIGGYGDPPNGFLNGQNSLTEWIFYWAMAKVYNNPKGNDVRLPPFYGGWPDWGYQVAELGGFVRAPGSAVIDFIVYQGRTIIGIRIQTERFHIFTDSRRQAYDQLQQASLERNGLTVIDIYDTELLGDPSGQKAVIAAKRAIGRLEKLNPVIARTAIRGSHMKVLG